MQLQYLSHTWPDIRIATTFAKQDPHPQAGVAILVPAGWEFSSHKVLVEHYAVAACVTFQACPVWLVSVYLPPKSPKSLVSRVFKALLTLETHPVFIGGDFNRCDQHHPQLWEDSLGQLGVTDVDPSFPTFRFGEQQESPLDRFLVPSFFLDTTQLHVRLTGRYRVSTCHHKTVTALLTMKPRLTPHPQSEKNTTLFQPKSFWIPLLSQLEKLKLSDSRLCGSCDEVASQRELRSRSSALHTFPFIGLELAAKLLQGLQTYLTPHETLQTIRQRTIGPAYPQRDVAMPV